MANELQVIFSQHPLRRYTKAQWDFYNPVLLNTEVGVNLTNQKFKVGNGASRWADLQYYSGMVTGPQGPADPLNFIDSETQASELLRGGYWENRGSTRAFTISDSTETTLTVFSSSGAITLNGSSSGTAIVQQGETVKVNVINGVLSLVSKTSILDVEDVVVRRQSAPTLDSLDLPNGTIAVTTDGTEIRVGNGNLGGEKFHSTGVLDTRYARIASARNTQDLTLVGASSSTFPGSPNFVAFTGFPTIPVSSGDTWSLEVNMVGIRTIASTPSDIAFVNMKINTPTVSALCGNATIFSNNSNYSHAALGSFNGVLITAGLYIAVNQYFFLKVNATVTFSQSGNISLQADTGLGSTLLLLKNSTILATKL
jgi:hypothetical protein